MRFGVPLSNAEQVYFTCNVFFIFQNLENHKLFLIFAPESMNHIHKPVAT